MFRGGCQGLRHRVGTRLMTLLWFGRPCLAFVRTTFSQQRASNTVSLPRRQSPRFIDNAARFLSSSKDDTRSSSMSRSTASTAATTYSSTSFTSSSDATNRMKQEAEQQMELLQDYYNSTAATFSTATTTGSTTPPPTSWTNPQRELLHDFPTAAFLTTTTTTTTIPTFWTTQEEASTYVHDNIDTVLFDCDGVLYRTLDLCPGASECIQSLLNQGKQVMFVTNNAGVNRRQLSDKLSKLLQLDCLTKDQMMSSSYSCARFLQQQLLQEQQLAPSSSSSTSSFSSSPPPPRVHVIGSAGLCDEIAAHGFTVTGGPRAEEPSSMTREELATYDFDDAKEGGEEGGGSMVDAIVVGHDTDFTFRKLTIANHLLLRNPNALLVATNRDSFDLVGDDGRHIPGNGCMVQALEYCSRRRAINVGKPSRELARLVALDHPTLNWSRALFVGDRLDTDIRFGNDNGMKSLLVMTGVTTANTLKGLGKGTVEEPLPHFIAPYIGLLTKME
jgi:phosphoglycolate/pyridoxal phosphate phosphatase family enzyme